MISRSGKGNFLAAHYDWIAAGIGALALVGAVAYCLVGSDVNAEIDAVTFSVDGRGGAKVGVASADLTAYDAATNVSKTLALAARLGERSANSFASEKRMLCDNPACGLATPTRTDVDGNVVCAFCHATQKVSQVVKVLDADGDGMPDAWEKKFGLNPNNPADAAFDKDGDGFTNLEEYEAKTDPTDRGSHPDYLDSLTIELPLRETVVPFLFTAANKIPTGWRCEFVDPKQKDDYGRLGRKYTAVIGEEIGTSGFVLKAFEQKSEKRAIKGSVNQKEVDISEVVVERKADGKKLTLVLAASRKAKLTPIDVQATLVYTRGEQKKFDVTPGSEIVLSGTKYKIGGITASAKGASVEIENVLTGAKRTLEP